MKLHRLIARTVYRRLDALKEENELLKMRLAQGGSDSSYTPEMFQALKELFEHHHQPLQVKTLEEVSAGFKGNPDRNDLAALFAKYGSDKSTSHHYHHLYETILKGRRQSELRILEVGLGTNNPDVPSNMGLLGKPGASLRAFSEWAPRATIVGADVDERILFNEGKISTFYVDQTKPETIRALADRFPRHSFDLVIDDGLHTPGANLNFVQVAIDLVKDDGAIIVEDIDRRHLLFWTAVSWALTKHRLDFVQTPSCCVVVIRKK